MSQIQQSNSLVVQVSKALPDFIGEGKFISESLLSRVLDQCCKGLTPQQSVEFLSVCAVRKLNPIANQIYAVPRKNHTTGQTSIVIQVGIDGLRDIAHRTGEFAGSDEPEWVIADNGLPEKCKVIVYRMGRGGNRNPYVGVAYWDEFAPKDLTARGSNMWRQFPKRMLEKCAEAAALRKGFPSEVGGFYDPAEIHAQEPKEVTSNKTAALNERFKIEQPIQITASEVVTEDIETSNEFVFPAGSKFQGKKISDIKPDELIAYSDTLEKWLEKNQAHKKSAEVSQTLAAISTYFDSQTPNAPESIEQGPENEAPL